MADFRTDSSRLSFVTNFGASNPSTSHRNPFKMWLTRAVANTETKTKSGVYLLRSKPLKCEMGCGDCSGIGICRQNGKLCWPSCLDVWRSWNEWRRFPRRSAARSRCTLSPLTRSRRWQLSQTARHRIHCIRPITTDSYNTLTVYTHPYIENSNYITLICFSRASKAAELSITNWTVGPICP